MRIAWRIVALASLLVVLAAFGWGATVTALINGLPPNVATPGMINFTDWSGSYAGTVVTDKLTSLSSTILFKHMGDLDYGIGDRLILDITNNTGATLTGMTFTLQGGTYNVSSLQPSLGTLVAGPAFTITPPANPGSAGVSGQVLSFAFVTPLLNGQTSALYVPVDLVPNSDHIADYAMLQTGITGVPEPSTMMLGGLGFGLMLLAKRLRKG